MFGKRNNRIAAVFVLSIATLLSPFGRAEQTNTSGFDFSDYDSVLKTFVGDKAMVNYSRLKARRQQLDVFVVALGKLPPQTYAKWNEKHKIAFWLNAYNGLTLSAIIDNYPIKSSFLRSRVWPKACSAEYPNIASAPEFQRRIIPSGSAKMMAS